MELYGSNKEQNNKVLDETSKPKENEDILNITTYKAFQRLTVDEMLELNNSTTKFFKVIFNPRNETLSTVIYQKCEDRLGDHYESLKDYTPEGILMFVTFGHYHYIVDYINMSNIICLFPDHSSY